MSEEGRNAYPEREEDEEVEDTQRSGQRGERHTPSGGNVQFQNPGNRGFIDQEAFDAINGNDGVARLAAQLHALQIEMQTLRERNQDPPRNIPASARQTEYVDQGIAARRGRAHAHMDCPSLLLLLSFIHFGHAILG
eukprot:2756246-Rhodomonas_salina.1